MKSTMLQKIYYVLAIVLLFSAMPTRGMSQTDDGTTTTVAPMHHRHVVKKAWNGTKQVVSKSAHATAHATGEAWDATKQGVTKGYRATAKATGKAWRGSKKAVSKGYNNTVHPHAKATHKRSVNQKDPNGQKGETK
jgi:hypothetical protein